MTIDEKWHLCRLTTEPENVDYCANWLLEHGCEGVQIEDTAIVFDQSEDATLVKREEVVLTGYRRDDQTETQQDLIEAAQRELDFKFDLYIEDVQSHDWANEWRENFPPLEIGKFLIVPSWESAPEGDLIPIVLDPGLAFGTGQHPTTRMCLELLGDVLEGQQGASILDVGCGSGILSIAAAKLGAKVVASDLDEWCTIATQENAVANKVEVEVHLNSDLDWVEKPFPFVVANLMSDLLIRLSEDLAKVTQSGGTLVISGISSPRADDVENALQAVGFTTTLKREMDGESRADGYTERWTAFTLQRN